MGLINTIFKSKKSETRAKKSDDLKETEKPAVVQVAQQKEETEKSAPKISPENKLEKSNYTPAIKVSQKDDATAYRMLYYPLITEKATDLVQFGKYCFVVPVNACKNEIKKTIINVYGVSPAKINFVRREGKRVRAGRRYGRTKAYKKAIVTLRPGDKIELYEGV